MNEHFIPTQYKYINSAGDVSFIPEELWKWQAHYTNHASLFQFDEKTGWFHRMAEIDQSRLKYLHISSSYYKEEHLITFPQVPFDLIIKHYRRYRNVGTPQQTLVTYFVFGYAEKNRNKKDFLVIHEDVVERVDDFNKILL